MAPWTLGLFCLWACTKAPVDTGADSQDTEDTHIYLPDCEDAVALEAPFVLGDQRACENPQETVTYVEVGESLGLGGPTDATHRYTEGGSVAVLDADDDGDLDFFLAFVDEPVTLYRWEGEAFEAEVYSEIDHPFMLTLADIDGNGSLDLLTGQRRPQAEALLNQGGDFEATELPQFNMGEGRFVRELSPGDLNGDGHVDLFAVTASSEEHPAEDRMDFLLLGDGTGNFTLEEGLEPSSVSGRMGFDAVWFDWQGDGTQDVYVVNDMGWNYGGNVFYANDGSALDPTGEDCACEVIQDGMGVDVGDYNGDGLPDLFLSAATRNLLLEAAGDGSFVDVTASLGADSVAEGDSMAWSGIFLDWDNDGDQDLLAAQGALLGSGQDRDNPGPLDLMSREGSAFENLAAGLGLAQSENYRSLVAVDFNDDGVLDLLATRVAERPLLYLSQGCTAEGWLEVQAPVGSRIQVEAGGAIQTAWISTESSCGAARPLTRHFGLGSATEVDALQVLQPDGQVFSAQGPFCARREVVVQP